MLGAALSAGPFYFAPIRQADAAESNRLLQLERQYQLAIVGEWVFDNGQIYGEESVGSLKQPQYRLIGVDALTGSATFHTKPAAQEIRARFFLQDYVIAQDGKYNRISIFDRKTGTRVGAKRLSQGTLSALEKDGMLFLLQDSRQGYGYVLSRFSLPNMTFLGQEQPAQYSGLVSPMFINGTIAGIRAGRCRDAPCRTELVAVTLDGKEVANIRLSEEPNQGNSCGDALGASRGALVVVRMDCGQYAVADRGRRYGDRPQSQSRLGPLRPRPCLVACGPARRSRRIPR